MIVLEAKTERERERDAHIHNRFAGEASFDRRQMTEKSGKTRKGK